MIEKFVLFVCPSRSGHSFIGSAIDAHPNACVGHEMNVMNKFIKGRWKDKDSMFRDIFDKTQVFDKNGRLTPNRFGDKHDQSMHGQVKGDMSGLILLGNKNGKIDLDIDDYMAHLEEFRRFIAPAEVRALSVLRNPLDASGNPDWYYTTQERYDELTIPKMVVCYEDFVRDTRNEMAAIVRFLGLPLDELHLATVDDKSYKEPIRSRRRMQHNKKYRAKKPLFKQACVDLPLYKRYESDLGDD